MRPIIHKCETPDELVKRIANFILEQVVNSNYSEFHLGLSGGTTPQQLFRFLSSNYRDIIPWHRIHFWWVDERMVDSETGQSNYGTANRLLLEPLNIPQDHVHRIRGEENPETESKRYSEEIKAMIPTKVKRPQFDLILLGMGEDGHTASIFPNRMELMEIEEITSVVEHPVTMEKRITLTGRVLNNSKVVAFIVTGKSKSKTLKEVLHPNGISAFYPAYHVRPKGELHWFADHAALNEHIQTGNSPIGLLSYLI